jgi:hypothetical protein
MHGNKNIHQIQDCAYHEGEKIMGVEMITDNFKSIYIISAIKLKTNMKHILHNFTT